MGNDWPSRTHSPMQNVNHGISPIHSTQVAHFSTHLGRLSNNCKCRTAASSLRRRGPETRAGWRASISHGSETLFCQMEKIQLLCRERIQKEFVNLNTPLLSLDVKNFPGILSEAEGMVGTSPTFVHHILYFEVLVSFLFPLSLSPATSSPDLISFLSPTLLFPPIFLPHTMSILSSLLFLRE